MEIKQKIYDLVSRFGIKTLVFLFPEYFAQDHIAPSDRYIEYPFVIRNLPRPPAKILDCGCAGSFFPLILSSFGYDTYAVDIRKYSILNRLEYQNFHFLRESICRTSFPPDYFDAISAISTLEHIGLSGDEKAMQEIKRIVKPEGSILITIPFGRAKILRPFSRIYDSNWVKKITKGLVIEIKEFYMQDKNEDWLKCT